MISPGSLLVIDKNQNHNLQQHAPWGCHICFALTKPNSGNPYKKTKQARLYLRIKMAGILAVLIQEIGRATRFFFGSSIKQTCRAGFLDEKSDLGICIFYHTYNICIFYIATCFVIHIPVN